MQLETLASFEDRHHEQFIEQGYLRLGKLLSPDELAAIQQRIDDIMLGKVRYENMRFQLDPSVYGERYDPYCREPRSNSELPPH